MQPLVYSFMALSAAGLGALAYFGLTFTPANAILVALVFACIFFVVMERLLRQRAESRLERAIEDLSRLLATDAQAGAVLGQRINALADVNPGQRLETVEADISVLGTVIRQVAEAVAEIEEKVDRADARPERAAPAPAPIPVVPVREREPAIPLDRLRQAVADNRLVHHVQPIVRLPQRRPVAYDLVPRLMLENGELADAPDFMPRRGGEDIVSQMEGIALIEAVTIARRSRTAGQPAMLHIPLSRATLGDELAAEQLLATIEANKAMAPGLLFLIAEAQWFSFAARERAVIESVARKGSGFSLSGLHSLRLDLPELSAMGVRSLRVDASRFIAAPDDFTDYHLSDIASYVARFDMALMATDIVDERQIVELLDNDILLVQGEHIAPAGPLRSDLVLEMPRPATARRRAEI